MWTILPRTVFDTLVDRVLSDDVWYLDVGDFLMIDSPETDGLLIKRA